MHARLLALAATLGLAAPGCTGFIEGQAAKSTYRILERSNEVARRQPDLELARAALPGGIFQLEAFALAYPGHAGFRRLHAEAICQYAVAFVFDDWEDAHLGQRPDEAARLVARLGPLLQQCVDANLRLVPASWAAARAEGADAMLALLPRVTRAQVGPLLWIATADAVLLGTDPMRHLGKLGVITAMLARCIELAPGFHDADAEILLGTLEAARGALLGGPDGAARFAAARAALGEGSLLVEVMFARGVAVARKDPALFAATLERVLAADVTRWPERRLANAIALAKARRYLAAQAVLFPAAAPAP